ncbi:hypothetical protein [Stenotrophomonas lacuserhaii]|uniref:hypothetical protein n=1 Tax=Stenotrophomonas lacuserhaii TaxID=2760084 RepID=UPI0032EFA04F
MRRTILPCLALLLITACHSETAMNQEITTAEKDVEQGGRGLAKLNPTPRHAYEFVLKINDAPGPINVVEAVAQYDVTNEEQCGRIQPETGTAGRITSQEPVKLRKVADGEYRGIVYLDRMLDEDYYGRGVCRWEFSGASAMLKATGAEGETRFTSFLESPAFAKSEPLTRYYANAVYPRAEALPDYRAGGEAAPTDYKPELQDSIFSVQLSARQVQP